GRRAAGLALTLVALAGFTAAPTDSRILFARATAVPRAVQAFAWRVIETGGNYQSYEREQRSFWAYDTRAQETGGGVVYSISVLSELPWKKTEPPAPIEQRIGDEGRRRRPAPPASCR